MTGNIYAIEQTRIQIEIDKISLLLKCPGLPDTEINKLMAKKFGLIGEFARAMRNEAFCKFELKLR